MTIASADPAAVRAHVIKVPMKAWATGEYPGSMILNFQMWLLIFASPLGNLGNDGHGGRFRA